MAADNSSGRSPWLVTILVAIITAAGAIAVAVISNQDNGTTPTDRGTDAHVASSVPATAGPDIEGDYYLDPGNPRVIVLDSVGVDRYSITERAPAPWPFSGIVEWTDHGRFDGIATFDSGSRIRVTLEPMPDGTLVANFDFITDDAGRSIDRVDKHVFVPVR